MMEDTRVVEKRAGIKEGLTRAKERRKDGDRMGEEGKWAEGE